MAPAPDRPTSLRWLAWLLPPLAPWLLHLPDLVSGAWFCGRDSAAFVYALRRWHWERLLADGQLPLWNDGLHCGLAHLSDPQLGLFSPLGLLYLAFDGYLAHELYLLTLLGLGGLGLALYLRARTGDRSAALALGACYPLSGVVLSNLVAAPFLAGACLFPWALWASLRYRARPSPGNLALLAACLAWPVLEGDPFGLFWVSALVFAEALLDSLRRRTREVLGVLAAGGLAALLSAPAWLPAFDTLGESLRAGGVPYAEASWFSLAPAQLVQLLVPGAWGYFADGTFWGQSLVAPELPYTRRFWLDSLHLGAPLLLLVGLGAWGALRRRGGGALLAFAALYTGVALGDAFVLHPLLHAGLPPYAHLRFPAKFFTYAHLCLFGLAGLGLAALRARLATAGGERAGARALVGAAGLFAAGLGLAWLLPWEAPGGRALLARAALHAGALGGAAALLGLLLWRRPARAGLAAWALVGLGLAALLLAAPPSLTAPAGALDAPSGLAAALDPAGGWHRLLRDGRLDREPPGRDDPVGRASLRPNWGLLEGARDSQGYAPSVPARLRTLTGSTLFDDLPTWARALGLSHVLTSLRPVARELRRAADAGRLEVLEALEAENLALLAIQPPGAPHELLRGCLAVEDAEAARAELLRLGPERSLAVLEPGEVLLGGRRLPPEARAAQPIDCPPREAGPADPGPAPGAGEARCVSRTARGRAFELALRGEAWLVLRDNFHPGWRARVDGREAPLVRADYLGMAVRLGPGDRRLEVEFDPPGPRWAGRLWLAGLALAAGALALGAARARRRRLSATPPAARMAPP